MVKESLTGVHILGRRLVIEDAQELSMGEVSLEKTSEKVRRAALGESIVNSERRAQMGLQVEGDKKQLIYSVLLNSFSH